MPDAGALLVQSFKDKNFGLPIAEENSVFRPTSRTAHAELTVFDTGITPLTASDTDEQIVILQAILRYPADTGDTEAKAKANEILDSYSFNEKISGTGIDAHVNAKKQQKGEPETGWFKLVLRITFLVYSDRV